ARPAFDMVVRATGVNPRDPGIPGQDHAKVCSYIDVLARGRVPGRRVAVIGAGGIGYDVSEFLVNGGHSPTLDPPAWFREWGVDTTMAARGGVAGVAPQPGPPAREVYLLQRGEGKFGARLGKTSGWVHRAALKAMRVQTIGGVVYERIDDRGLHLRIGNDIRVLDVDDIVLCAGQESNRELLHPLQAGGQEVHVIGGADVATELDAKRAIDQAVRLAARL
ncbi:MAG TPA: FAD-dependent oxidoreductase, partial [Pseudomonadota bacterium]|nr:FAD-dependent oxidoreductase [Pseudomonadota bacterium]